jgi:hypothetical protein
MNATRPVITPEIIVAMPAQIRLMTMIVRWPYLSPR